MTVEVKFNSFQLSDEQFFLRLRYNHTTQLNPSYRFRIQTKLILLNDICFDFVSLRFKKLTSPENIANFVV